MLLGNGTVTRRVSFWSASITTEVQAGRNPGHANVSSCWFGGETKGLCWLLLERRVLWQIIIRSIFRTVERRSKLFSLNGVCCEASWVKVCRFGLQPSDSPGECVWLFLPVWLNVQISEHGCFNIQWKECTQCLDPLWQLTASRVQSLHPAVA